MEFRNGMIMLSTLKGNKYDKLLNVPSELKGFNTQALFIIIEESKLKAHYENAKQHEADIILPLKEKANGKGYTCRDPEGHCSNFGTYNPWL